MPMRNFQKTALAAAPRLSQTGMLRPLYTGMGLVVILLIGTHARIVATNSATGLGNELTGKRERDINSYHNSPHVW